MLLKIYEAQICNLGILGCKTHTLYFDHQCLMCVYFYFLDIQDNVCNNLDLKHINI